MYTKLITPSPNNPTTRAILLKSHHERKGQRKKGDPTLRSPRTQSTFNTKSYNDALQRSFNRAKTQIYFNPDMIHFITLTYKSLQKDYTEVMYDIKQLVKNEKRKGNNLKYIYVLEWQERGSLHVHMIANSALTTHINKNGYKSLTFWRHGFSSMLTIKDFDKNFKPYLYLFKYMRKAQRIGKSFIHSSRNLNTFTEQKNTDLQDYSQWSVSLQERTVAKITDEMTLVHYRYFLNRDIITEQSIIHKEKL